MIDHLNLWLRRVPTWPLYILGVLYPVWLLYQGMTGALGVDPVKALEHAIGKAGLQLLLVTLLVTPLRRFVGLNLLKFRRALGLLTFFYIALHLLVWFVLDVQIASQVWADIVKRPYITIGMAGFLLMVPLAITSNNTSVRRLGRKWITLHKLTYLVAILGAVHYVMLVKGFQIEPLLYLGAVLLLLSLRRIPRRRRIRAA
ncbi:protein-methionine-sulfoxide reductase heme-binding subunit MsrQ [Shimia sp. FJ5]|uniref:protein-methionine-sulfoxide reductase heme-binding subunit MsrQ n=1 Tax=Shimia sp. FJ5 TaxID=3079054 RepID=UPI002620934B|nr:protein-methionine-sulfoxide reductase heme-binding subunit MsrQ [Shimia sp. FJ5]MDV4144480.1 protein-methionine-sulfoxide reductase heme-binding subunit MsrQ [Shimia sp. FJ5]